MNKEELENWVNENINIWGIDSVQDIVEQVLIPFAEYSKVQTNDGELYEYCKNEEPFVLMRFRNHQNTNKDG